MARVKTECRSAKKQARASVAGRPTAAAVAEDLLIDMSEFFPTDGGDEEKTETTKKTASQRLREERDAKELAAMTTVEGIARCSSASNEHEEAPHDADPDEHHEHGHPVELLEASSWHTTLCEGCRAGGAARRRWARVSRRPCRAARRVRAGEGPTGAPG